MKEPRFSLIEIALFIIGFSAPTSLSGEFTIFKGVTFVLIGIICGYGMLSLYRNFTKIKE